VGKSINLTGQERPDRLIGAFVSDNFFDMLGIRAVLGRAFVAGDDKPGAAPVAVISYEVWQTRFGADSQILGRKLILNNQAFTVVGVLPGGFSLPVSPSEVFVPAQFQDAYSHDRKIRPFLVFGRLKDEVSREEATADLNTIAQSLARDYPRENAGIHVELAGLQELTTERVRTPLLVLLGAVAMVLLLVCANLANLLLARGAGRQREVAVRAPAAEDWHGNSSPSPCCWPCLEALEEPCWPGSFSEFWKRSHPLMSPSAIQLCLIFACWRLRPRSRSSQDCSLA
jgi:hypothetical protein